MKKIILGIDPGTRIAGYGLIQVSWDSQGSSSASPAVEPLAYGAITLSAEELPVRLKELGLSMEAILKKYQPQEMAIEKIFLGKNADSAFKLGHARGVLMYESFKFGCSVFEYATRTVKKSLTGNGGAEKEEVRRHLQLQLGLSEIHPIDASDALAMACHHAFEIQRLQIYKRAVEL